MRQSNSNLSERIAEARRIADTGKVGEALKLLDQLAVEYPESAAVAYEQASVTTGHVPHHQALQAANAYAKRFPTDHNGPLLQAYTYLQMRKEGAALEQLNAAGKLGAPDHALSPLRAVSCN